MLATHYGEIRVLHVGCVIVSGTLFTIRGLMRLANLTIANHLALRYAAHTVDTVLLLAAILLTLILHQYPIANAWLTAKVILLFLYIGLGSIALKRASTRWARALALFGAWLTYLFIIGVAIAHHPAGWLLLMRR